MRFLKLILMLSFVLPALASALPDTSMFGMEVDSLEWKRAELEDWLTWRTTKDLTPFMSPELFRVQFRVKFKERSRSQATVSNVNVPLLGTVATLTTDQKAQPQLGLFDRIDRVDVTLVVSNKVNEATAQEMLKVIQQKIPVIKADKVFAEIVRIESPGKSYWDWLSEFKYLVAAFLMFGLFLAWLHVTLPKVKIQTLVRVGPRGEATEAAALREEPRPGSRPEVLPSVVTKATVVSPNPTKSGFDHLDKIYAKALTPVELARLRSSALTLPISNCVSFVSSDPKLGSLLIHLLPSEKAMKVMAQLPEGLGHEVNKCAFDWNQESLTRTSVVLMAKIQKFKGGDGATAAVKATGKSEAAGSPEKDEKLYREYISNGQFEELSRLAHSSAPEEVIGLFPLDILFAAFERLSFPQRASLLAAADSKLRERLCPSNSENSVHLALHREVDQIRNDPMSLAQAKAAWPQFVKRVREAVQKNPHLHKMAAPIIDNWLWQKSEGAVGASWSGAKDKKRGDAA